MAGIKDKYGKLMTGAGAFKLKLLPALLWGALLSATISAPAFSGDVTLSAIGENTISSVSLVPGLITALSYLFALLLGVTGILKLKDHVENPSNTPLRTPIIRFIAGGALLALPIIYEAMESAINAGTDTDFDPSIFTVSGFLSGLFGTAATFLSDLTNGVATVADLNGILGTIIISLQSLPGVVSGLAYLFGLVLGVIGILKIKEHVENPDQNPLREGVIRLITGGALFAIPTIYAAMSSLIAGEDGIGLMGQISNVLGTTLTFAYSSYATGIDGLCTPLDAIAPGILSSSTLGNSICGILTHAGALPAFLTAISYLFGVVLGFWGILKIKDHVLNPQTSIWEGISRLFAGGAFFALPVVVETMRATITTPVLSGVATVAATTGYNETVTGCTPPGGIVGDLIGDFLGDGDDPVVAGGLDVALYCLMYDVLGPIHVLLNFFAFVAGMIFIMIGISRLMKSAQEGAKAPGGLGTLMTFLAGGALISYNELIRAFTSTFSMGGVIGAALPITATQANLAYDVGLTDGETAHVHTVISAILKFMIVIGLISFIRGIFIIRNVAEGNGQASLMAGVTHMVGGALAVNLGPLMNAVQATLGIAGYGIGFT